MTVPIDANRLEIPLYAELPILPGLGIRHSWNVFGPGDELGTLNLLDDATVMAALQEAKSGERIGVTLEMAAIDPPFYGRDPLRHSLMQTDRNIWDDRLDSFFPQGSTQWDGFRHVRCREFGFYGGVTVDPTEMGDRLGIHHWAAKGIVARGVLLDVERNLSTKGVDYQALTELSIDAGLLEEIAEVQGVQIRRGDVLCLRFGWVDGYRNLDQVERRAYATAKTLPPYAGMAADESMAQALWDWQVAAVACDNPGAEVSPGDPAVGSLHRRLIPTLGLVVGELFDFDELAVRCAADGRWSFLFLAVPLNIQGGVGSPANAIVIR
jgi:kynurenine formamidase